MRWPWGRVWLLRVRGQEIRTTGEHPFYVVDRGWIEAANLAAGDVLLTKEGGYVGVESCEDTGEFEVVYNLRVAEWHTYFVGDEDWDWGVWSHNACIGVEGERYARKLLEARGFTTLGTIINKNNNGIDILARDRKGKLWFFEVKTSESGKAPSLNKFQAAGAQAYVWDRLNMAAGNTAHPTQPWRWASSNHRGPHTQNFAKSLISELDKAAGGLGKGQSAIRGMVIEITDFARGSRGVGSSYSFIPWK